MNEIDRTKYLKFALRVVAVICVAGFYPLTVFWPSSWAWHSGYGDVPALFMVAAVLGWLSSRALTLRLAAHAA